MSNAGENTMPLADAREIEAQAADWFQRRRFWNWTDEDQKKLDAWLEESMAHSVAFWRLETGFEGTERLTALRHPRFGTVEEAPRGRWRPILFRTAAALVVIGAIGAFALRYEEPAPFEKTYATAVGATKSIKLADGTVIELNTNSKLRVSISRRQRYVWLDRGEAYFQVAHDESRPFVVTAGKRRITDLGTKFLVRRGHEQVEIAVSQGRVRLEAADEAHTFAPVELIKGEVVVANDKQIVVKTKTPKKLADELGWRHGVLIFDHTTLADAAREFNRYNEGKLIIEDPEVASLTIDGTFRSNNVGLFARAAKDLLGLRIEVRGSDMVIMR
jgi:transmembrane sensor